MSSTCSQVRIYLIELDARLDGVVTLSANEIERARSMRIGIIWKRARTALRLVLAGEVKGNPSEIVIHESRGAKPRTAGVEFNLSHSGDWVAIATSHESPVGIDLEKIRPDFNWKSVAARFLPTQNIQSEAEFFECWTKQEAYLKGLGTGLKGGLDTTPESSWSVVPIEAPEGYAAALAVRSRDYVVSSRSLW
jgi:4'-phosphopantetheinyl transferase